MKPVESRRKFVCFHEAGHAVAARLCGLPIKFVRINLKGVGTLGEVYTLFGETHHLHYHSVFQHLAGPLAEKFAEVGPAQTNGIAALKDVVQATILMRRLFTQDPASEAQQAQQNSPIPGAFFNIDEVAFVADRLNQVSREIDSVFGQPDVQRAIKSFALKLISMGDGVLDGLIATNFIDKALAMRVGSITCPNWYVRICKDKQDLGWSLEIEELDWKEVREGRSRYDN